MDGGVVAEPAQRIGQADLNRLGLGRGVGGDHHNVLAVEKSGLVDRGNHQLHGLLGSEGIGEETPVRGGDDARWLWIGGHERRLVVHGDAMTGRTGQSTGVEDHDRRDRFGGL